MPTTNEILPGNTMDISPFYLARQAASAAAGTESFQPAADGPPEIVVIGNPSVGYTYDWPTFFFLPGVQMPPVANISSIPGYQPLTFAWNNNLTTTYQHLKQRQEIVRQRLAAKADSDGITIYFKDSFGQSRAITINFGELKAMYNAFTYNIVFNMKLNPGYGGFTTKDANGNYFSNVDTQTILGYYYNWQDSGMDYYVLHELSHNLPSVKLYENVTASNWLMDTGSPNYNTPAYAASANFNNIEAATNTVARGIAQALGLVLPANPPHGYLPPN